MAKRVQIPVFNGKKELTNLCNFTTETQVCFTTGSLDFTGWLQQDVILKYGITK